MDLFEQKNIHPMLIGADGEPFDSPDYIYELNLDGERCIAYLDPKEGAYLRNKRSVKMLPKFPELSDLHKQVKKRCILDGELTIIKDGRPNFAEIQRRSLMSNQFKIRLAAQQFPATFVAFDCLYLDGEDITTRKLTDCKDALHKVVKESGRLALSRVVEVRGVDFYCLAEERDLEGIVAKRKDSIYTQDKRTKDWIKIKNLKDDDFVVCGYIRKGNHMTSIVLGQYRDGELVYKGHVTLGVGGKPFARIAEQPTIYAPPFPVPPGNGNAVWVRTELVCTVKYMEKTASGGMRQPVFKGMRDDKKQKNAYRPIRRQKKPIAY